MKNTILVIISLILMGCGKQVDVFSVDSRLLPYYKSFVKEGRVRGQNWATNNLTMEFGNISGPAIGQCWQGDIEDGLEKFHVRKVIIDIWFWAHADEPSRRMLVYHELGHCLMNKDHDERTTNGLPASIMYPAHLGSLYVPRESRYLDQFFGVGPAVVSKLELIKENEIIPELGQPID